MGTEVKMCWKEKASDVSDHSVSMFGGFSPPTSDSWASAECPTFNSVMTLSAWRQPQIPWVMGSVLQVRLPSTCMLSHFSPVWLFAIPWTVTLQGSLSLGLSKQEHWSRLPFPPPGDLLTQLRNLGLLCCRQILYCWATGEALSLPLQMPIPSPG